jgi:hypothetical protein
VTAQRLRTVFLVDAVYSVGTGALLLMGTWDGLYDALDLPQGKPAVFVQIGGAMLWAFAYLLWLAARTPALMLPMARASALANGLSTVVLVTWLIADLADDKLEAVGVDTLGIVLLIAAAAISAVFTALYLKAGIRPGGYGPEPPPPPDR